MRKQEILYKIIKFLGNIFPKTTSFSTILINFGKTDKYGKIYLLDEVDIPKKTSVYFDREEAVLNNKNNANIIGTSTFEISGNTLIGNIEINKSHPKSKMALKFIEYGAKFKIDGIGKEEYKDTSKTIIRDYKIIGISLYFEIE